MGGCAVNTHAPRTPEGLVLFEVYEANGSLLAVSSFLPDDLDRTDVVYRRPWATAAQAERRSPLGLWEST